MVGVSGGIDRPKPQEEAVKSMKNFLFLTIGGEMPADEAEGKKVMAAWMAWFDKLGDSLVDSGAPLGDRKTVGGTAVTNATGYCIVKAADLKAAVAMAKACPGCVEVLETVPQM